MIPGTVPCDVSAGHVTAGLSPVSWRRGISYGFAQFPVGTGVMPQAANCPKAKRLYKPFGDPQNAFRVLTFKNQQFFADF